MENKNVRLQKKDNTPRWYAVLVQMNAEHRVPQQLARLGYTDTYLPAQEEIHQWSDRRKKIRKVLIPMVVFVHIAPSEVDNVRFLSFIRRFVTRPGESRPSVIPDEQIDTLKYMVGNADGPVTFENHTFEAGQKVRVVRGNLQGLEGVVTLTQKGKSKISIQIDEIGCASVSIDPDSLQYLAD